MSRLRPSSPPESRVRAILRRVRVPVLTRLERAVVLVERAFSIAMHIAKANTEYKHPFLVRRTDVKRVGVIVVTRMRRSGRSARSAFTSGADALTARIGVQPR